MSEDDIKVIDVKTENMEKVSDTIKIDTSNNRGLNIYNTRVPLIGSKTFNESKPLINGSGAAL